MENTAVAYVRVSREDEKIENQIEAIKKYAEKNGIRIVAWFKDVGVSGATEAESREGFNAMLKFCEDNNVKMVLFYDISRMSRNIVDGLKTLKELTDRGFKFKFVAQEFLDYIEDPMLRKKVILDFLWFAEFYIEDIRRRTKIALERLKAMGVKLGRPKMKLPEDRIKRLYKQGLKPPHIAKVLQAEGINVSADTIRRRLREWGLYVGRKEKKENA